MPQVTVTFEMNDGRILKCQYGYRIIPGNISGPPEFCYPDETDVGEPTYYLDDNEINLSDLPTGLDTIAEQMYEDTGQDKRFSYKEEQFADWGPSDYDDHD